MVNKVLMMIAIFSKTAIKMRIPYMTNIAAAKASLEGIMEMKIHGSHEVKSLQEYHAGIK